MSGYELYLKTYRSGFDAQERDRADHLSNEGRFYPAPVIFSVIQRLYRYFERLKGERNKEAYRKIDFMIGKIRSKVKYSTVDAILHQGGLHDYLSTA